MHRLKLDFLHPFPRPHWTAWLLLAAGLGLAAWVGWQDQQVGRALAVAAAESPAPRMPPAARRASRAEPGEDQVAAESSRVQLATPWGGLFVRLESNRPKRIALLALEADARKPEATLTAEARSAKDMLAWVEQLKGEAGFRSVTLASHTLQESDPQQPIRFVLRLVWRS
ncbi:PilN domain-containing protein [Thiobacillus sp.]